LGFSGKILLIGDLILDHFIYGNVNRISPEAPVPVVEVDKEIDMLGGCGNVFSNLYNLGIKVKMLTAIGSDKSGKILLDKLTDMNIQLDTTFISEKVSTNNIMRIIANNQHLVRVDRDNTIICKDIEDSIYSKIEKDIKDVDCVIISDYQKGVCTDSIIQKTINISKRLNKPTFVDPKGNNWKKYSGATFITPNIKEIISIVNRLPEKTSDFILAGEEVIKKYNIENCLITRGADGMTFVNNNESFHVDAKAKEVYDVSGAGDTVIASLAAGIISGRSVKDAVKLSNLAASIVVSHIGTSAITLNELGL